ncbi:MAG: hypothetical protein OCU18_03815 [Candidatus Syntrophoarchaeum sp.]|nr:hypothetical protein [Candidatus Syntrophoarchaeum sp.]
MLGLNFTFTIGNREFEATAYYEPEEPQTGFRKQIVIGKIYGVSASQEDSILAKYGDAIENTAMETAEKMLGEGKHG